jgi:hypothetical protein
MVTPPADLGHGFCSDRPLEADPPVRVGLTVYGFCTGLGGKPVFGRGRGILSFSEEYFWPARTSLGTAAVSLAASRAVLEAALSGGRIRANNRAAVFHLLSLNSPTRPGGF